MINVLQKSIKTESWEKYQSEEEDTYMEFFMYFESEGINLCCSDEILGNRIAKNIDIFESDNLKQILVNEMVSEKNYKKLFEEIEE